MICRPVPGLKEPGETHGPVWPRNNEIVATKTTTWTGPRGVLTLPSGSSRVARRFDRQDESDRPVVRAHEGTREKRFRRRIRSGGGKKFSTPLNAARDSLHTNIILRIRVYYTQYSGFRPSESAFRHFNSLRERAMVGYEFFTFFSPVHDKIHSVRNIEPVYG